MNAGKIWWEQIGNSLRFLSGISNTLAESRSVVLSLPAKLPWRQDFYEAVDLRRAAFSGQRRLKRLSWASGTEPGAFVLEELCSDRVRADYWPGQTYGAYLGSREELMLHDYYVWITGIHSKSDLNAWLEFVAQYEHAARNLEQRGVFVLEYDGAEMDVSDAAHLCYSVKHYDCRVFCLESAAALSNTELLSYQAELALSIAGADPELCFALLQSGGRFLRRPVQTAVEGNWIPPIGEQRAASAAWKAALVLLYPILERRRMDIIASHIPELAQKMPITNSNGEKTTDPWDLELGQLWHILQSSDRIFSSQEAEDISLCRRVRNLLAHNKIVPYDDVLAVFAL